MHEWETRMLLKHYLDRGVSKAELSRRFGVSRRTIHEWVVTGQLDRDLSAGGSRYSPRPPVPHKLDPYAGIIDSRLEEFPGLSAQRLFDEVRAAGYSGSYGRVRDYVRAVRPWEVPEPVVRFETPAGHQGQVDFATFTLPWGRRYALVVVLSHSRLLWLCFYHRQTMAVLTGGLETAFERFGGVPKELLFDQMLGGRAVGPARGRRRARVECGVSAVCRALEVPPAGVPAVSSPDEGQGGAADPLHPGELLLRTCVRERRGPERAGVELGGGHGQRTPPRYDGRAPRGPLRAG